MPVPLISKEGALCIGNGRRFEQIHETSSNSSVCRCDKTTDEGCSSRSAGPVSKKRISSYRFQQLLSKNVLLPDTSGTRRLLRSFTRCGDHAGKRTIIALQAESQTESHRLGQVRCGEWSGTLAEIRVRGDRLVAAGAGSWNVIAPAEGSVRSGLGRVNTTKEM